VPVPPIWLRRFQTANLVGRLSTKPGLAGRYNFTLGFAFEPGQTSASGPGVVGKDAPSIFSAIQEQLGLKLEPSTALIETLVIDHIERPTEN
jgi:uncharacterized protein (TIGR03435 family)